jgi:hypothetical protein
LVLILKSLVDESITPYLSNQSVALSIGDSFRSALIPDGRLTSTRESEAPISTSASQHRWELLRLEESGKLVICGTIEAKRAEVQPQSTVGDEEVCACGRRLVFQSCETLSETEASGETTI